jgi:transcription elongation GreA/GreB family factor
MARALVGKSVDDEVKVKTLSGERYLVVTAIRY